MAVEHYISSDSHVLEPEQLWVEQMDKAFRAQAPRVVHNPPGYEGDYWLFGDRAPGGRETAHLPGSGEVGRSRTSGRPTGDHQR